MGGTVWRIFYVLSFGISIFGYGMRFRTIIIIIIIILGYFFFVVKGFSPVAFVGWQPILKKSFGAQVAAYQRAYDAGLAVFPAFRDKKLIEEKKGKVDPKKILEKMIQEKLIEIGAGSLKINNLKQEVAKEISNSLVERDKLQKSLKTLYNWDLDEFKEFYLEPKALKEIIAKELWKSNRTFGEWFSILTKDIKVRILIPGYQWDAAKGEVL